MDVEGKETPKAYTLLSDATYSLHVSTCQFCSCRGVGTYMQCYLFCSKVGSPNSYNCRPQLDFLLIASSCLQGRHATFLV